jgi:predicted DNA-binding transcriptional regulator AlpA
MNHKTAASFLGMSRTKLYETERDDPGFPQRITVGKKKYFRTAELQEFISQHSLKR